MRRKRLVKPSIKTKFHVDFNWWEKEERDFRIYLWSYLCPECKKVYTSHLGTEEVDWVDQETAEVSKVDGLWQSLRTCCSHKSDYITDATPLVDSVFRIFLANGNSPLSPIELHNIIKKGSPDSILRTLAGGRVYYGIRPVKREGRR
jgi:hypothetical protein